MKTISSRDAQNNFGSLLDSAIREPVTIQRHGRSVAVLVSLDEFERLQRLEDEHWLGEAQKGEASGYLSTDETSKAIAELLKRAEG